MTAVAHPVLETRAAIVFALTGKPRTLLELFYTVGIQPTPASAQAVDKWVKCLRKHGLVEVSEDEEGAPLITWVASASDVDPLPEASKIDNFADRHVLAVQLLMNRASTAAELMDRLSRFGFSTSNGPMHGITVWLEALEHEGLVTHAPGEKATKSTSGRFPRVWSWASPGHQDQQTNF